MMNFHGNFGLLRIETCVMRRPQEVTRFLAALNGLYAAISEIDECIVALAQSPAVKTVANWSAESKRGITILPEHLSNLREAAASIEYSRNLARQDIYPHTDNPSVTMRILRNEGSLFISSMRMNSPGFWEFIGALNPLEALRKILHDKHERAKDIEYRNKHENIKLEMENEKRRLELLEISDTIAYRRIDELRRCGENKDELLRLTKYVLSQRLPEFGKDLDEANITRVSEVTPAPDDYSR